MPANTSVPYGPGSTPQCPGPPQQAQESSFQQPLQQKKRTSSGSSEISSALSEDERQSYSNIFRAWDPQGTGFISGETGVQIFAESGLSLYDLSCIWNLADSTNRGSLNLSEFQVAMGLIYRAKNGAPIPIDLPPELVPSSKISWALSENELQSYNKIFRAWDPQGTGFISGEAGVEIFRESGLSPYELGCIWHLADPTNRGSLNLPEFQVAMGLIYRAKNGARIPTVLPVELSPSSERDTGDLVNIREDILVQGSHERTSNDSSLNRQDGKIRSFQGTPEGDSSYKRSSRHLDRHTTRYGELEDELSDLKYRVKEVQEDLDRTTRGPPNVRKDEQLQRLEKELLELRGDIPD